MDAHPVYFCNQKSKLLPTVLDGFVICDPTRPEDFQQSQNPFAFELFLLQLKKAHLLIMPFSNDQAFRGSQFESFHKVALAQYTMSQFDSAEDFLHGIHRSSGVKYFTQVSFGRWVAEERHAAARTGLLRESHGHSEFDHTTHET